MLSRAATRPYISFQAQAREWHYWSELCSARARGSELCSSRGRAILLPALLCLFLDSSRQKACSPIHHALLLLLPFHGWTSLFSSSSSRAVEMTPLISLLVYLTS